jgi:hypothetical protein
MISDNPWFLVGTVGAGFPPENGGLEKTCPYGQTCPDHPYGRICPFEAISGITMIAVTHEMGFAKAAADEVVFMDKSQIVEKARPEVFFDHPARARTRLFLSQILER